MTLLDTIQHQMQTGMITGVTLALWVIRRLPNEPTYSATVRWVADRDNTRGKGGTLVEAFAAATGTFTLPMVDPVEGLINELGYAHMNLGLSGLSPVDPGSVFFVNARINSTMAPLLLGRGATLKQAIERLK